MPNERSVTKEFGFAFSGAADGKGATGETRVLLELNIFLIGVTARGIEEE